MSVTRAKLRLKTAIDEVEASRPAAPVPRIQDDEQDGMEVGELSQKEVKWLKRQARKRKWVRRLNQCNTYVHALCKSVAIKCCFV